DSAAALTIKTNAGAALFTVDTTNSIVSIGSGGRLRLTGVAGDPASLVDGDLWYNTTQKSFRSKTAAGTVGLSGLLYTNTTIPAGNTWSNTTAENNFASNYSLPADSLIPGKVIKITARGSHGTTSVTGGNMNIRLKFGSTVLVATGSQVLTPGLNSNTGWQAEFTITGVSNTTVEAQGRATYSNGSISTANTALVTLDTTLGHTIQLSEQWSSASNSNTITLRQLIIEVLN
ncbi:MAG TPA: hypothetical protein VK963_00200, partial [Candidatus Saccharimonadales bacterium]|nr:hypothetical protein [Candidatus Saccharimonadales bacterium]